MKLARDKKVMLGTKIQASVTSLRTAMTGLNTRDDYEGMAPTDAIVLDNFYADVGGLVLRNGSTPVVTGIGAGVETLAEFYSKANRKLLAGASSQILDVSTPGSHGGVVLGSGFGSARWIAQNFKDRIFFTNGVDPCQVYDGSTLAAAGFTGMPSPPAGVFLFKERLYFWLPASNSFYFAGLDAVTGAVTEFPLSTIAKFGGNIMLLTNFSHDGGDGVTNTFCIIMTTGEVILYLGNDPSTIDTWQLTGTYKLAAPVNARSAATYGADTYLTTLDDHLALQEQLVALKVGQVPPRSKISGAVATALTTNPHAFGYQAIFYGAGRRLLFNIPNLNGTYDQHVFNTSNQSWQRFRGMRALCWSEFNNKLYFGTPTGEVWQADVGNSDNGAPINGDCQQAWNKLETLQRKRIAGIRPVVKAARGQGFNFYLGYDYKDLNKIISVGTTTGLSTLWDVSPWDTSLWAPDPAVRTEMDTAEGTGTAVGFRITVASTVAFDWMRTDLLVVPSNTF